MLENFVIDFILAGECILHRMYIAKRFLFFQLAIIDNGKL